MRQIGQTSEAAISLEKAVQLDAHHLSARQDLAHALLSLGKTARALEVLEAGLDGSKNDLPALTLMAYVRASHPQLQFRNGPEAIRLAEKALALNCDSNPKLLLTLAAAQAEVGNFPEAQRIAEQVLTLCGSLDILSQAARYQIALYKKHCPFHDDTLVQAVTPTKRK